MSENFAIKGGGFGRLMANAILNFHFDYWHTSLTWNICWTQKEWSVLLLLRLIMIINCRSGKHMWPSFNVDVGALFFRMGYDLSSCTFCFIFYWNVFTIFVTAQVLTSVSWNKDLAIITDDINSIQPYPANFDKGNWASWENNNYYYI